MKIDRSGPAHPHFSERVPSVPARPRRLVRVRAIGNRRFRVADQVIAEGEVIDIDDYVAADLIALGKAEFA